MLSCSAMAFNGYRAPSLLEKGSFPLIYFTAPSSSLFAKATFTFLMYDAKNLQLKTTLTVLWTRYALSFIFVLTISCSMPYCHRSFGNGSPLFHTSWAIRPIFLHIFLLL